MPIDRKDMKDFETKLKEERKAELGAIKGIGRVHKTIELENLKTQRVVNSMKLKLQPPGTNPQMTNTTTPSAAKTTGHGQNQGQGQGR